MHKMGVEDLFRIRFDLRFCLHVFVNNMLCKYPVFSHMQIILDNALHLLGFICICDPYHGEVDMQLLMHVKGAGQQNEAVIRSPDTYVFLMLFAFVDSFSAPVYIGM